MKIKYINLAVLILSTILIFIIGVWLEIDYRILTKKSIKYFANYKIDYYGAKEFRFLGTDIAFILTLIPISYYFLNKNLTLHRTKLKLALLYIIATIGFYCFYCYTESEFIRLTYTLPIDKNGVLLYHHNNVNFRGILFMTIISTSIIGLVAKKLINYSANKSKK